MYKIVPVSIPIVGEVNTLTIQVNPFALFPATVQLYITLKGASAFYERNMTVPAEVVSEWGTDDTVVLNYVLGQLGVELAPESEQATEPITE